MKKTFNFLKKAVNWYFEQTKDSVYMCPSCMIPLKYSNNNIQKAA